jgi:uncharacterized protein YbjT (DUF2867 family)
MLTDKLILVTGATGYIASRLIPRLLDSGYRVRCLAREPLHLKGRSWFRHVEVVQADVMVPSTLHAALEGVHTAYYLVHSMSYGHGYTALELNSARAFAFAAETAGVEHIIYLGGLADPEQEIAPHLCSRIKTGRALREGRVPVTEFRSGVIIGSGSISFEMIRFMTELFPIVPGPLWMKNKSQPIAIQNVIDYLLAALTNPRARRRLRDRRFDVLKYENLGICCLRGSGAGYSCFGTPYGSWRWRGAHDTVRYPIAYALIMGCLPMVVKHPEALTYSPKSSH